MFKDPFGTFTAKIPDRVKIHFVILLYLIIAIAASIQSFYGSMQPFGLTGRQYSNYNNYILFKNSFKHLILGLDLYKSYPAEQWDLYKYSPTFALFFGVFAYLPDFIGLLGWNLLNTVLILTGFFQLRAMTDNNKLYALLFCSIELLGSLQNAQSNGLLAGLMILTFTSLENKRYVLATFLVVFSVYIKIYGGIAFLLFLFYPLKSKLLSFSVCWFFLLGAMPLMVIHFNQLLKLYENWHQLLIFDQHHSTGISVMGILHSWFNVPVSKNQIILLGAVMCLFPLVQVWKYKDYRFKLSMLCICLIGIIIFNYKAESPTYIISVCGISIWFFAAEKTKINKWLIVLTFIFTSLSTGDLFPDMLKANLKFYNVKALFPAIIFFRIFFEVLKREYKSSIPKPVTGLQTGY